ncbi:MAG TPA: YdcF family protein [Pirellulales bacterium]
MTLCCVRSGRRLVLIAMLALLGAAAWMNSTRLLTGLGGWLDVGERPLAVDYALPLGGDCNSRPFVAADLYRAGLAPQVLVPRPGRAPTVLRGEELAHDEIYRLVLLKLAVKEQDIIMLEGENHSTFDEARRLRDFLADGGPKSVAVVTSDFHTRRTRWTFRHVLRGMPHQLHFISAPVMDHCADNWWQSAEGTTAYSCELLKLVFYWCYYGPGMFWGGALLVSGSAAGVLWVRRGDRLRTRRHSAVCAR